MTEKSVALPPQIVKKFTLDSVRVQFVQINQEVNHTYRTPFPKQLSRPVEYIFHRARLISWHEYRHLEIELDENGQVKGGIVWLVAALYDGLKAVIKSVPRGEWLRILPNERLWEGTYRFDNGLVLRLIVWKKLGKVVVKDKNGRPKLDKQRRMKTKWAPVYYSYLTNPAAQLRSSCGRGSSRGSLWAALGGGRLH
jgi:hypothetical protein